MTEIQDCPKNINSRGSRTTSNSRKLHNSNSSGDPFFTSIISKDTNLNCHFKKNDLHFEAFFFFSLQPTFSNFLIYFNEGGVGGMRKNKIAANTSLLPKHGEF